MLTRLYQDFILGLKNIGEMTKFLQIFERANIRKLLILTNDWNLHYIFAYANKF